MIFEQLLEENSMDYFGMIPDDCLFNIDREYVRGIVGQDNRTREMTAVIVWELKNVESEKLPTEAEVLWFYAMDENSGGEILKEFEKNLYVDEVHRTWFEMQELSNEEQAALKAAGYSVTETESIDLTFTCKELSSFNLLKRDPPDYIMSLSELTSREYREGIMTTVFHGRYGLLDDLPFIPMSRFDPYISSCVFLDDKVKGFLLVHEKKSGDFMPELFFAIEPDANLHLLQMLHFSVRSAVYYRAPEDTIIVRRHNDATKKLTAKLFPGKKGENVTWCEKEY